MEHPVVQGESSTSNSSSPEWKYDVFLSFAGRDTRLKFTDHLDAAFNRSGIKTFRDDVDLERGANIKQDLFQAIQESLCAVLIFTENYAASKYLGSKAIQAIIIRDNNCGLGKIEVHPEAFSKMGNIRLLHFMNYNDLLVLPRGLKLSRALKVVIWQSLSLEALPLETSLDKLVHIQMHDSKIKQLWNGRQNMRALKFIYLSHCNDFIETPDFSGVPNLEHLCLRGCISLVKVHSSLGELKKLVELDFVACVNLEILPKKLETNSLAKLNLMMCEKVAELPEFGEGMKKLSILNVKDTRIIRLPKSFGSLTGLKRLNLDHCKILNLKEWGKASISRQVSRLTVVSLTELNLGWCHLNDGLIPVDSSSLSSSLVVLNLSGNDFVNLPNDCFSSLDRLAILSLDGCANLKLLPRLPPRLIRLNAFDCYSMEPLSGVQLWNVVASLDHENRGRTEFVMAKAEESVLLRDFCAIIPARSKEIPSCTYLSISILKNGPELLYASCLS